MKPGLAEDPAQVADSPVERRARNAQMAGHCPIRLAFEQQADHGSELGGQLLDDAGYIDAKREQFRRRPGTPPDAQENLVLANDVAENSPGSEWLGRLG